MANINHYDAIRRVVETAMEGAAEGNPTKLRSAFHPGAMMFGEVHKTRYDAPIEAFFHLCQQHPLGTSGRYRYRIVSITQVQDAAMVMVTEDGCWDAAAFVDLFTVTLMGDIWKITNKTFAFLGGNIPEEVLEG
jgi:Putative lumazine-binding